MIRFAALAVGLFASAAVAQDRRPSHCIAIADAAPGLQYLHKATYTEPVPDFSVRIHYVDHSMFLIQAPGGLNAITDFNGNTGSVDFVPDVVTMNRAHSTHWTPNPDPRIPNVLKGWGETPAGADHHVDLGEMLIRNVSTDIRSGFAGQEDNGNSIFVFEVEGLCIGHLGHLHHEPSEEDYAALGRLDVVMAAVDGGLTLPTDDIAKIVKRLRSSIVLPMHWWGRGSLDLFLAEMSDTFEIVEVDGPDLIVSLNSLPSRPTVMVLKPQFLRVFNE